MVLVEFLHNYANSRVVFLAGQRAELSEEQVAFLERDSPGCLKRVEAPAVDKAVKAPKVNKMVEAPAQDKTAEG